MTKIITWNVNGIRAVLKKGFIEFVERQNPDMLCLQETKASPEQVDPEVLQLHGMTSCWASAVKKGYSGVATFCKEKPIQISNQIGISEYDQEGRVVFSDHKGFRLYNIYFPNGGSGEERHKFKQKFLNQILECFKKDIKEGRELIVVGDYNVAHLEIDVHDPVRLSKVSGFLPEERAWFDSFLQSGFVDCFRYLHPKTKEAYTWWDYRTLARVSNKGWRIDYICMTSGLTSSLKKAEILDQQEGSDHCPVLIEIEA